MLQCLRFTKRYSVDFLSATANFDLRHLQELLKEKRLAIVDTNIVEDGNKGSFVVYSYLEYLKSKGYELLIPPTVCEELKHRKEEIPSHFKVIQFPSDMKIFLNARVEALIEEIQKQNLASSDWVQQDNSKNDLLILL